MSLAVRVIPCLDVAAGRVVKGVQFADLRDAGDPVELAAPLRRRGRRRADVPRHHGVQRRPRHHARGGDAAPPSRCSSRSPSAAACARVEDVDRLLRAGADKVRCQHGGRRSPRAAGRGRRPVRRAGARALGRRPPLPRRRRTDSGFEVTTHGGRRGTGIDAVAWAARAAELGAGEILLNSMDADGTKEGFDLELVRLVRAAVRRAADRQRWGRRRGARAAGGGRGADAVLAASIFHFGQVTIARGQAGTGGRPGTRCASPVRCRTEGVPRSEARADRGAGSRSDLGNGADVRALHVAPRAVRARPGHPPRAAHVHGRRRGQRALRRDDRRLGVGARTCDQGRHHPVVPQRPRRRRRPGPRRRAARRRGAAAGHRRHRPPGRRRHRRLRPRRDLPPPGDGAVPAAAAGLAQPAPDRAAAVQRERRRRGHVPGVRAVAHGDRRRRHARRRGRRDAGRRPGARPHRASASSRRSSRSTSSSSGGCRRW